MEQESSASSLKDMLIIFFKHKYKIFGLFFLIVSSVTAVSFLMTPRYEVKSSIMVKFGREYIYKPETGKAEEIPVFFDRQEVMNTEVAILNSNDLLEKVVARIGVDKLYPEILEHPPKKMTPFKKAVLQFQKDLVIYHLKKSDVVNLFLTHKDPEVAARTINTLVDFFTERHLQLYSNPKSQFLESQLALYRQRLDKSESDLELFKQKHGVYSLTEQRSIMLQQQAGLSTELRSTKNRIRMLQEKVMALNVQLETVPETVIEYNETQKNRMIDDAMTKLLDLQLQEQQLLLKYDENHRLVSHIRREIQVVRDFLYEHGENSTQSVRIGKNQLFHDLEKERVQTLTELSSLEGRTAAMEEQIATLEDDLREIDAKEVMLYNLKREQETNEDNYKSFLTKLEESRVNEEMDRQKMANIRVIQKAIPPAKPIKPNKLLNITISLVLGAAVSIAFAIFSEFVIDQSLSTPAAVEKRLGIPVLATIAQKEM